jgi:hypothetical protein
MKDFSTDDAKLSAALRQWNVTEALPPRFQEQVWQRIARAEAPRPGNPWLEIQQWLAGLLMRPSWAVSYAVILLTLGVAGGYWQARLGTERANESLSARYVQMLDPYQIPRQ